MAWSKDSSGAWTHAGSARDVVIAPESFGERAAIVLQVRQPADEVLAFVWGSGDGRSGFEIGIVGSNVLVRKVDFGVVGAGLATAAHGLTAGIPFVMEVRVDGDSVSVFFNGSAVAALTYTNSAGTYIDFIHWGFVSSVAGAVAMSVKLADLVVDPSTGGEVVVVVASGSIYYTLDLVNFTLIRANEMKRNGPVSLASFERTVYAADGANVRKIDMDTFSVSKWGGTTAITALPGATESSPGVFVAGSSVATPVFDHTGRVGLVNSNELDFAAIGDGDDFNFAALDQPGRAWGTGVDLPGKISRPIRGVLSSTKGVLIVGTDDGVYRLYGDYSLDGVPDLSPLLRGTGISGAESMALAREGMAIGHGPDGLLVIPESGGAFNLTERFLTDVVQIPRESITGYLVQVRRETNKAKTWAFLTPVDDSARARAICYEERVGNFDPTGYGVFPMDFPAWVGPTASCVARGKVLMGTRTGRIVTFSDTAGDDCGEAIPMKFSVFLDEGDSADDTVIEELAVVLGRTSGNVAVSVYGGVSAEDALVGDRDLKYTVTARASEPGVKFHHRARAPALVADFTHSTVGERVSIESIGVATTIDAPTHRGPRTVKAAPMAPCEVPPDTTPPTVPPFDDGPGVASFNAIPDQQQLEPEMSGIDVQTTDQFTDAGIVVHVYTVESYDDSGVVNP